MLTRDGYRHHSRKLREKQCEICKSTSMLCGHHINKDWTDNRPENIKTLCFSCHTSLHHKQGDIMPKKEKMPCIVCGKQSYRSTERLCNTHRTRMRRYGNPLVVRKWDGASWRLVLETSGLNGQALQELQNKYPVGWTDLEHSEIPSCRKSLNESEGR